MPTDTSGIPPAMAGAGLLVAAAVLGPEPPLPRIVATGMARLGDASYAIYLTHPFILRPLTLGWGTLMLTSSLAASLVSVTVLLLVFGLALITYSWFEAPTTRLLTGWATASRRISPAPRSAID